jgi:hypothetical protein
MSTSNTHAEALTIKQRVFIGGLAVISILLSALVLFCFSPAEATSEALPCPHLPRAVYEASFRS